MKKYLNPRTDPFSPGRAFVLAAGYGTRMAPLSLHTPKPAMPLWGRPMIARTLDMLADWGVKEVMVNLHHRPEAIVGCLEKYAPVCMRIVYSQEPEILGTGGALRRAASFCAGGPFWIINADVAAELDPEPLLRAFRDRRLLAALWLHHELGPRSVSVKNGLVANFKSGRPAGGGRTFCGLHLVSPAVMDFIPGHGFYSVIRAYERAIRAGGRIGGVSVENSFWRDIGSPESYLEAHAAARAMHAAGRPGAGLFDPKIEARAMRLKKRGVEIEGFVALGQNVSVAGGASLQDCVLWDGAAALAGARVRNAIVCSCAAVRGRVERMALMADVVTGAGEHDADAERLESVLREMRMPPARTVIMPMQPRGSDRAFTRLRHGRRMAVAVLYGTERLENELYARNARFLKSLGVRTPEILFEDKAGRALALEDLGDESLLDVVREGRSRRIAALYRASLDAAFAMHARGAREARRRRLPLAPAFSPEVYGWERELFARHFLEGRLGLPHSRITRMTRELARAGRELGLAPQALVHRDLQSTNVLIANGVPVFIDFQGMRYGPAVYDLASLLFDPYVELDAAFQDELFAYYIRKAGWERDCARHLFRMAAVQRLAQALGAYARLAAGPETRRFAGHIPAGLRMMLRAIGPAAGDFPGLAELAAQELESESKTSVGRG